MIEHVLNVRKECCSGAGAGIEPGAASPAKTTPTATAKSSCASPATAWEPTAGKTAAALGAFTFVNLFTSEDRYRF